MVKLGRYSSGIRLIQNALSASADALQLFAFIFGVLVVVLASALYYTERGEYNDTNGKYERVNSVTGVTEISPFQSIPSCFWWSIVTLVTVGYGEVYPVTPSGYIVGILTQMTGVIVLALPLSIIGANFHEEREKMNVDAELEEMPLIDERGWLETADAVVDGGESAFESLEVLSLGMAECLCSILELSYARNVISLGAVEENNIEHNGSGKDMPTPSKDMPGVVNHPDSADPSAGSGTGNGSGIDEDTSSKYIKVNQETMDLLVSKIENMAGIVKEMHNELMD